MSKAKHRHAALAFAVAALVFALVGMLPTTSFADATDNPAEVIGQQGPTEVEGEPAMGENEAAPAADESEPAAIEDPAADVSEPASAAEAPAADEVEPAAAEEAPAADEEEPTEDAAAVPAAVAAAPNADRDEPADATMKMIGEGGEVTRVVKPGDTVKWETTAPAMPFQPYQTAYEFRYDLNGTKKCYDVNIHPTVKVVLKNGAVIELSEEDEEFYVWALDEYFSVDKPYVSQYGNTYSRLSGDWATDWREEEQQKDGAPAYLHPNYQRMVIFLNDVRTDSKLAEKLKAVGGLDGATPTSYGRDPLR